MLALAWWNSTALTAVAALAAALAAYEFARMYARSAITIWSPVAAGLAVMPVARWALDEPDRWRLDAVFAAGAAILLLSRLGLPESGSRFAGWALTLTGALYTGGLLGLAVPLRALPDGVVWVWLALAVTWAYDAAAFGLGRTVGRHGFATSISPRKTWEGVAGGTLGAIAVTAAFAPFLPIEWWQVAPFGLAWSAAAQSGDLVASLIKRDTGHKDTGALIPGHGGMLDRIDSLLFVVPAVYAVARLAA